MSLALGAMVARVAQRWSYPSRHLAMAACAACRGVPPSYKGVKVPEGMEAHTFDLAKGVVDGDRVALSLESERWDHCKQADLLLDYVCQVKRHSSPEADTKPSTFRLGVTGPPGAGKSTFVEAFGKLLTARGFRVAVMCIDPSSVLTGGSLLGDKTRMIELSVDPNAYVRPSPSNGELGGVAEHTADLILLTEAASYDFVIVETVGLGQSEVVVDDMVDMFMLVMPPTMGDSLQGVKKGIMEHSDAIVINKCDGLLEKCAPAPFFPLLRTVENAIEEHKKALGMCNTKSHYWNPRVLKCSALKKAYLDDIWKCVDDFWRQGLESGELVEKRQQQNEKAMWKQMKKFLKRKAHQNDEVQKMARSLHDEMLGGTMSRRKAATILSETFLATMRQ